MKLGKCYSLEGDYHEELESHGKLLLGSQFSSVSSEREYSLTGRKTFARDLVQDKTQIDSFHRNGKPSVSYMSFGWNLGVPLMGLSVIIMS